MTAVALNCGSGFVTLPPVPEIPVRPEVRRRARGGPGWHRRRCRTDDARAAGPGVDVSGYRRDAGSAAGWPTVLRAYRPDWRPRKRDIDNVVAGTGFEPADQAIMSPPALPLSYPATAPPIVADAARSRWLIDGNANGAGAQRPPAGSDTGGTGVDEDRGFGSAGGATAAAADRAGTPAGGEPPPPPPAAPPTTAPPPAGARSPGCPAGPQGWVRRRRSRPPGAPRHPARRSAGTGRRRATTAACGRASSSAGSSSCSLIVGGIAASVFVGQLVEQIQENPDAVFGGECQLVSGVEVSDALGEDVEVLALEGFADGDDGRDPRQARCCRTPTDCWILRTTARPAGSRWSTRTPQTAFRNSRAEADGELPRRRRRRARRRGVLHDDRRAGLGRRARPVRRASRLREHGRRVGSTTRRCARRRRCDREDARARSGSTSRRAGQWLGPGAAAAGRRSYSSSSIPIVTSP